MKFAGKISLFLSSYLPCWIIIASSQGLVLNAISGTGLLFCVASLYSLIEFTRTYNVPTASNIQNLTIENISNGSSEVVSYLVTLVIPAATSTNLSTMLQGEKLTNILVFLVTGFTIFLIYTTTNLVVINPMLVIIGYSLYKITYIIESDHEVKIDAILISKGSFTPSEASKNLCVQKIDNDVFLINR